MLRADSHEIPLSGSGLHTLRAISVFFYVSGVDINHVSRTTTPAVSAAEFVAAPSRSRGFLEKRDQQKVKNADCHIAWLPVQASGHFGIDLERRGT